MIGLLRWKDKTNTCQLDRFYHLIGCSIFLQPKAFFSEIGLPNEVRNDRKLAILGCMALGIIHADDKNEKQFHLNGKSFIRFCQVENLSTLANLIKQMWYMG